MATGPATLWHYAANSNFVNGVYAPGIDGFNVADVSSVSELDALPAGDKGLVYLGQTSGVTSAFINAVTPFLGNSKVLAFYLADEPNPSLVSAANLKAESDWIHAHFPGSKTFIVEYNTSDNTTPNFAFNPANTGIDLYGLDPYPVQTNVPNGLDYSIIPLAVKEALKIGIPLSSIVPVYQAFGGGQYTTYTLPTPTQEKQILATWGSVVPHPVFDYAYSWGSQLGDTALTDDPALAAVFAAHNGVGETTKPTIAMTAQPAITGDSASGATIELTGTQSDAVGIVGVEIFNGSTDLGAAKLGANGTWTFRTLLTPGAYTSLKARAMNVVGLTSTVSAGVSISVSGLTVTRSWSNGESAKSTYNTDGSLHDILWAGITGRPFTSYDVVYVGGKPASATFNNGMTATWTFKSDGAHEINNFGVTDEPFTSAANLFNPSNALGAQARGMADGSGQLVLRAGDLTVSSGAGAFSVKNGGDTFALTAHSNESMVATGQSNDVFQYHSGFGSSSISGFVTAGTGRDVLQFDAAMFKGVSASATDAANWAAMLANHSALQVGGNVVITDLHHDTLLLSSTTLTSLTSNAAADFKFV